jgi:hypothetical protein
MFQADTFQNDSFQIFGLDIRVLRIYGNDGDSIIRATLSPIGSGDVIGSGTMPNVSGDGRIPIIIVRD